MGGVLKSYDVPYATAGFALMTISSVLHCRALSVLSFSGKADIQADIIRNDPSQTISRSDNVRVEGGVAGARPPQELAEVSGHGMGPECACLSERGRASTHRFSLACLLPPLGPQPPFLLHSS